MKNTHTAKRIFLYLTCLLFSLNIFSQQTDSFKGNFHFSTQDSLIGFDEIAASKAAIDEGYLQSELALRMSQLKRAYINNKYNLEVPQTNSDYQEKTMQSICSNLDFESSSDGIITSSTQVSDWIITRGTHTLVPGGNSCNLLGCCPQVPLTSKMFNAPFGVLDTIIGTVYPILSVFGSTTMPNGGMFYNPQLNEKMYGNNFIRINSPWLTATYASGIEKISRSFSVSPENNLLRLALINVFSLGHGCCDAAETEFNIQSSNTNSLVSCPAFSIFGISSACNSFVGVNFFDVGTGSPHNLNSSGQTIFNKWQIFCLDLKAFIGQTVTLNVSSNDCTANGHFGYSYLDAECTKAFDASINETIDSTGALITCKSTATLVAKTGFTSYLWTGPTGSISSNQTCTVNNSGTYTLTTQSFPMCTDIIRTINVQVNSNAIHTDRNNYCVGETATLSVNNGNSYLWNTNDTTSQIVVNINGPSIYTVAVQNNYGCSRNLSFTLNVNNCDGLKEAVDDNQFNLFPNPNHEEFNVIISKKKAYLKLTNEIGIVVCQQELLQGENHIKTKQLAVGFYFYTVYSDSGLIGRGKLKIE